MTEEERSVCSKTLRSPGTVITPTVIGEGRSCRLQPRNVVVSAFLHEVTSWNKKQRLPLILQARICLVNAKTPLTHFCHLQRVKTEPNPRSTAAPRTYAAEQRGRWSGAPEEDAKRKPRRGLNPGGRCRTTSKWITGDLVRRCLPNPRSTQSSLERPEF